jgi:hypothetical protein
MPPAATNFNRTSVAVSHVPQIQEIPAFAGMTPNNYHIPFSSFVQFQPTRLGKEFALKEMSATSGQNLFEHFQMRDVYASKPAA